MREVSAQGFLSKNVGCLFLRNVDVIDDFLGFARIVAFSFWLDAFHPRGESR